MAFDVRDRHTFSGPGTVSAMHTDAIQIIVTSARPRQAMVRWMAIGRSAVARVRICEGTWQVNAFVGTSFPTALF